MATVGFLCSWAAHTGASDIRLNFELEGWVPERCAVAGVPVRMYVLAFLGGDAAADGAIGFEFAIDGFDPAWMTLVTPNPAADYLEGSPLGSGCRIAFPWCQSPSVVLLFTIDVILNTPLESTRVLRVVAHESPSNPSSHCPVVSLCDSHYTKLCVAGGDARLLACEVGVQPATWSAVKELYSGAREQP